jgi:O-antigen ligase
MSPEPSDSPLAGPGSKLALVVLVALAVVSPWPFGSVDPWATRTIALVALTTALVAMAWDARQGALRLARFPTWAWLGLWLLAALQFLPLPAALHASLAPGSAFVWHPDVSEAAAILGPGPFPISLHPEATRRWLAFTSGLVALALAAAPALRERTLLLRATIALVAGGTAVAVFGLVARLVFGNKLYGVWSVPTVAPFGPFVSKNHFAGYVELAALLAVGLATGLAEEARRDRGWLSWIESRRAKWVVLAWGTAFVLVLAVLVSLSRGGVLAVSAGLAAFVLLRLWARGSSRLSPRGMLAAIGLLALVAIGVASLLPTEARDRVISLGAVTSEASGSYRLTVWRDTRRLIASSPLVGSGFGAYADALRRFRTAAGEVDVEHAESDLLEAVAEGGAVGALVIGSFAGFVLLAGLRAARTEPQRLQRSVATGALAGVLALGIHGLFDFNLHLPSNALLFAALAAVLLAYVPAPAHSRGLAGLTGAAVLASLALALTTTWHSARYDPEPLRRAGLLAATALRRATLEGEARSHLSERPAEAKAWMALAWLNQTETSRSPQLAAWAERLDPTNAGVRKAARNLSR